MTRPIGQFEIQESSLTFPNFMKDRTKSVWDGCHVYTTGLGADLIAGAMLILKDTTSNVDRYEKYVETDVSAEDVAGADPRTWMILLAHKYVKRGSVDITLTIGGNPIVLVDNGYGLAVDAATGNRICVIDYDSGFLNFTTDADVTAAVVDYTYRNGICKGILKDDVEDAQANGRSFILKSGPVNVLHSAISPSWNDALATDLVNHYSGNPITEREK